MVTTRIFHSPAPIAASTKFGRPRSKSGGTKWPKAPSIRQLNIAARAGESGSRNAIEELDAHHITNRNDMPNGGYAAENGVSLCKYGPSPTCHEKAEQWLTAGTGEPGFSPAELYAKIGSSYESAVAKSRQL